MKKAPAKSEELEHRVLDKECILLLPEKGEFYKTNEVGTRVWQLINGKREGEAIAKQIGREFDVKEERAKKDVKKFLNALKKKKIIK